LTRPPLLGQFVTELRAGWAIAKKDMVIYYVRPNIIVTGLLFPLFMFLAFSVGNTQSPGAEIPGLLAITILFSASSIMPVSVPIERRTKTFDRLLSAPVSLNALVFGESMSGFLFSLAIAIVPFFAGLLIFNTPVNHAVALVIGFALSSFVVASLGTLFAAYPTESPGDVMSMLNVVRLPMMFISGVFIPLASIPEPWHAIIYFSPLTYGYDLIQSSYSGTTHIDPVLDVIMLLVFIAIFQVLAIRLYKRSSV